MSEFSEKNWAETLTNVYKKSIEDAAYRALCLTDPIAAIKQVSDIDLPPGLKIQFFDKREEFLYSFLLPPLPTPGANQQETVDALIHWQTYCTNATTG